MQQVANTVDGSTYNGKSLLGTTGAGTAAGDVKVVATETGTQATITNEDNRDLAKNLWALIGGTFTAGTPASAGPPAVAATPNTFTDPASITAVQTAAVTALTDTTATGGITGLQKGVASQLNQASADSNLLDATISFNSSKVDSLNAGLGALIDADLSKESANLQALQIRQQLGTQALSLANQSPQSLLSLFK